MLQLQCALRMSERRLLPVCECSKDTSGWLALGCAVDVARRGGFLSGKKISPNAIEGYVQELRNQHNADVKKVVEESWKSVGRCSVQKECEIARPPGLSRREGNFVAHRSVGAVERSVSEHNVAEPEKHAYFELVCDGVAQTGGQTDHFQVLCEADAVRTLNVNVERCSEVDGVKGTSDRMMEKVPLGAQSDVVQMVCQESNLGPLPQIREEDDDVNPRGEEVITTNAPVIYSEEVYKRTRTAYNPGVGDIPHDFLRFGPTEMQSPLREILRSADEWAFVQYIDGKEWSVTDVETEEEVCVGGLAKSKDVEGNQASFARENDKWQRRFGRDIWPGEVGNGGPRALLRATSEVSGEHCQSSGRDTAKA